MNRAPGLVQRALGTLFRCYDALWRRCHGVRPVDDLISVSTARYRGAQRRLPDGVAIARGDRLGILHFNHGGVGDGDTRGTLRAALRFRRRILRSLARLEGYLQNDPELREVKAVYGLTWMRPHGEQLGFVVDRLPEGLLTRLRRCHFRLLLHAFFPTLAHRESERLHPHAFWLSRRQLRQRFGPAPAGADHARSH